MLPSTILLLDQKTRTRARFAEVLSREGHTVKEVEEFSEAVALARKGVRLILAERSLGAAELARELADLSPPPLVLALDAFAKESESPPPGIHAIVATPLADHALLGLVERTLETQRLRDEQERLAAAGDDLESFGELISRDSKMRRIFELLTTIADSQATILITGESGTGKSALARSVHARSTRADGPFIGVNCGALPESLLASELFGHVKGAFTGAVSDRVGKYEAAHEGSLFLDEIGTAPMDLQVKLLRVLEEGRFERVGESATREADVRVIAATNVNLSEAVKERRFREDLYYRLNVVAVEMPPLRERPDDVLCLAERFVTQFAARHRRRVEGLDAGALRALSSHDWPGNVRELQNTLERAVLLSGRPLITTEDLWPTRSGDRSASTDAGALLERWRKDSLKSAVESFERWCIERVLEEESGSRSRTARRLGINRTTLFNKMRKYALLTSESGPSDSSTNLGQAG